MITYCPHCGTPLLEEQERYWGDDPPQFNEITFTSNREGLRWLTGQILRIADAEPGSHTHLEREAHAPIVTSAADWQLTIAIEEDTAREQIRREKWSLKTLPSITIGAGQQSSS